MDNVRRKRLVDIDPSRFSAYMNVHIIYFIVADDKLAET
jgi:hypothetical protein